MTKVSRGGSRRLLSSDRTCRGTTINIFRHADFAISKPWFDDFVTGTVTWLKILTLCGLPQLTVVGGTLMMTDSTLMVSGAATSPSDRVAAVMFNNGSGILKRVRFNRVASGSGAMVGACAVMHICVYISVDIYLCTLSM